MNYPDFASTLKSTLHVGTILPNPGGGTSTIVTYGQATISYKRGRSRITVSLRDFHNAYLHFRGGQVSSSDLRGFNPGVFDSKANGHSSNCTMFFIVLLAMGMIDRIHGEGKAHQPYWVYINA